MPSDPAIYPYDTIVFITGTMGGRTVQGSGVLISPDEVLTASHVVYSSTYGAASRVIVSLGYDRGIAAIGSVAAATVHYNRILDPGDTISTQQSQFDYAVIHLSTPFTSVGTMGLQANFAGGAVNVSGYPAVAGGQLQTTQEFVFRQSSYTILTGTSIGAGSSGGPVWIRGSNGEPEVVGLVSSAAGGVGSAGYFSQISGAALNQIDAWVTADDGAGLATAAGAALAGLNTSTQRPLTLVTTLYSGPLTGLQQEYINVTADSLNIAASSPGWFIHSGGGNDAIAVSSGTNVLDGGTGSNFLTGGSGTDTFFADERGAAADLWDTINNFHAGDAATLWGVVPGKFGLTWNDNEGAAGYLGLTLHLTAAEQPNVSLTLVGFDQGDLTNGRLSVTYGTEAASGSAYMYVADIR